MRGSKNHINIDPSDESEKSTFILGQASVESDGPVVAGAFTTIYYTYTCGHPFDDSGYLKITFRSTSDVATPQFDHPSAPNYATVTTTGNCDIEPRWDPKGHIRPWSRALFLKIRGGYLNTGEKITVTFGDTTKGSPGWQMQTSCVEIFEFKTFADPIASYQFKEIPNSPFVSIKPGKPVRAICIAPSQAKIQQSFDYQLKLEDRWGNPTGKPRKYSHHGFEKPGIKTVAAIDTSTRLSAVSNPIDVQAQDQGLNKYWADFHGQTGETVGAGSIEDYFSFARDLGLLDIAAHSGNDFQITDEFWKKINQTTENYYAPGKFVTFPGFEWSGNTPLGGDRNVYFEAEGGGITRSSRELLPGNYSEYSDSPTVADLFASLKISAGPRPFTFAHVGGRYANLDMHDPDIELAVEVHSAWGTFEWILADAFERGYRVGICANSDGHKCRPGASYPGAGKFGSLGGLTCVLAKGLDRGNIITALRARHFYGTTGNRPLIDLSLNLNEETFIMGDILEPGSNIPVLHTRIAGTAPLDRIEVRNALRVIKRYRTYRETDLGNRIKIVWSGAQGRGRDRMVNWDGNLTISDNSITNAVPLNFWNANKTLNQTNETQIEWESNTTGGTAGMILTLGHAYTGKIIIHTAQGDCETAVENIGMEPSIWNYGGLQKAIRIYRLPSIQEVNKLSFQLPLTNLNEGDNPIYIHMVQEDEHMAWTSPIYLSI